MGGSQSTGAVICNNVSEPFYNTKGEYVGAVVEYHCNDTVVCGSWLLLPAENLWSKEIRGFLYLIAMIWIFVGIAIASDIFMMSIEVITAKKRTVVVWDAEKQQKVERQVLVWNETVANLTLMALGSSAPEILIAVVEAVSKLPMTSAQAEFYRRQDGLGVFTIMGSASYNLLVISAICIIAPKLPDIKKVSQFSVFLLTSLWSIWAYIWMLLVVRFISPNVVEVWEAWLTLAFFPLMAITAYCQDNGWWIWKCQRNAQVVGVSGDEESVPVTHSRHHEGPKPNIRVLNHHEHHGHGGLLHGPSKELQLIEAENMHREQRRSHGHLDDVEEGQEFRHAAVKTMMGSNHSNQNHHRPRSSKSRDARIQNAQEATRNANLANPLNQDDLMGKFTFGAPSYSVLESAGFLEVDVLFHRKKPANSKPKLINGNNNSINSSLSNGTVETNLADVDDITGVVSCQWETREGSAKLNRDFKFSSGKLVFNSGETKKTITIPIVNDNEFEPDTDFYIILKNPEGESGLGDPSITRVTIIDDDEPGHFLFSKPHYQADSGKCTVTVLRQKGCDGTVSVEYATIDGNAKGGETLDDADYIVSTGILEFKHGEASKTINLRCSEAKKARNFIVTLKNPSVGAKIGAHPAAVINLSADDLGGKLVDLLAEEEDEEPMTWAGQFEAALTLSPEDDEDGDEEPVLKWYDYLLHFIALPWKLFCAIIPPKHWLGGSLTFIFSIAVIGFQSALVEQLAGLLGCVVNLKTAVSGITLVALGTSVPDTFASRTAAIQDEHADAAIGNITGSNSVNVFLGLGLPWVLLSMWYTYYLGEPYNVPSGNLTQAVVLFLIVGLICLFSLFIRRMTVGGELGGPKISAYISAVVLLLLWLTFLIIVSLIVYEIISWPALD